MPNRDPTPFRPHALIVTERTRPQPLFMAAFFGVNRLLRLELDLTAPGASFPRQALTGLQRRLAEFPDVAEGLPSFGRPTGVLVNYAPDCAIRYDLEGRVQELLPAAVQLSEVELTFGEPWSPPKP
jgi:hypothetical protein